MEEYYNLMIMYSKLPISVRCFVSLCIVVILMVMLQILFPSTDNEDEEYDNFLK